MTFELVFIFLVLVIGLSMYIKHIMTMRELDRLRDEYVKRKVASGIPDKTKVGETKKVQRLKPYSSDEDRPTT